VDDTIKGFPFTSISEERAVDDVIADEPILVVWGAQDTAFALDTRDITEGRSVGTGLAYLRTVGGQVLTFEAQGDDTFVDAETITTWDLLGKAITGPLEGTQLETAIHTNEF
jgi:hypothetical protein